MQELDFSQSSAYFDFKSFVINILSHWYWFLICVCIGLGIAYYVSVRKLPVYKMESLITLKEDQNPLFTNSNTSLTFNWGGQSSKTNSTITTLKTRTHNEKVVKHLQFYLDYMVEGEYQMEDAYGKTPFTINLKEDTYQLKGQLMKIVLLDENFFEISFEIQEEPRYLSYYNYKKEEGFTEKFEPGVYKEKFEIGKPVLSKFFNGTVERIDNSKNKSTPFYIKLQDFNSVVKNYQNIRVGLQEQGSSIIKLELIGENKIKLVDYLNTTTKILSNTQLEQKNLFATKTIKFIDSTLNEKANELEDFENELNKYKLDNNIIDLDSEASQLKQELITYDLELKELNRKLDYLSVLENYLTNRSTYEDPPAPSIAGIEEGSIVEGVRRIVELSLERSKYQYAAKPDLPEFKDIDRQIDAAKTVLKENIGSSKQNIYREIDIVEQELKSVERKVQKLPSNQQGLLKIERRFNISQQTYDLFLAKRNEAKLIKASNVSDIQIIDEAKDVGNRKIGPNNQLNYVMAVFFGLGVPLVYVFFLVLLDNRINTPEDIERLTDIPVIGVVGKSKKGDRATLEQPNSVISESFRNIRTSLQFVFKNNNVEGCKTIMVTSSFSGEGKTFNAVNLASVLSIGGKKTVVVGLDLRKPKIHENFEIDENIGVSTYITGQHSYEEIIQSSGFENFDIVPSGIIPPNPSELLISDAMDELMVKLKQDYEFIILDTPPIGLVSDALNLIIYADATLYIIRQHYTKKGMLNLINNKTKKGEIKNVNLVFNYYKAKQKLGYGYGYGYSYGYGKYGKGYGYSKKEKGKNRILERLNDLFK
jgi:capsular exopolysaccharide synthesis family protein